MDLPEISVGCDICGIESRRPDISLDEWKASIPADSHLHDDRRSSHLGVYDRDGQPISMLHWTWLIEFHPEYKIVRHTHDSTPDLISTVWLGLDHSFGYLYGEHVPLIFETMIFGGEHDQYQERYSTEEQALDGHARAELMVS